MAELIDPASGDRFPLGEKLWRAPSGRPLMISGLVGLRRNEIINEERSLWRYRAALPIAMTDVVSLGEGCTPLVQGEYEGHRCRFKLEWFSPTGTFKDRGASVMITFLKQQGIQSIVEDSSGNGGAAIAAFAAAAGIDATILVPEDTQPAKITQTQAYDASVVKVPGDRQASERAALEMADSTFYAGHNWSPFFLQGTKTLGYEIWEDLGFRAPDNIIIPTGAGSALLGCYLAFRELLEVGEIERLPRLFATQPRNCAPIHACFQNETTDPETLELRPTIAEGTSIQNPLRLEEILYALNDVGGGTVAVSEDDIVTACLTLARNGLYVDPSCGHAAASLPRLVNGGQISPKDETVIILTGSGLKATSSYARFQSP